MKKQGAPKKAKVPKPKRDMAGENNPNKPKYLAEDLLPLALDIISKDKDIVSIQDLISCLPCQSSTFYSVFPADSQDLAIIKASIDQNKISIKKDLRKKWQAGDNVTAQISLYKLLSTPDELQRLSNYKANDQDETKVDVVDFDFEVVK